MELKLEFLSTIKQQLSKFNKNNNSKDGFIVGSTLAHEIEGGKTEPQQFGLVENASNGKKPIRNSAKLPVNWSRGKGSSGDCSKGKAVLRCGEVEELQKRLKFLEEETKTMKQALFGSIEERNNLVKEIYQQFQQLHGFHFLSNLLIEENSTACGFLPMVTLFHSTWSVIRYFSAPSFARFADFDTEKGRKKLFFSILVCFI